MKKKIFSIAVALVGIAIAGYHVYRAESKQYVVSDILKANVEALAFSELTPDGWVCFKEYYDDTSNPNYVIITECNHCTSVSATWGKETGNCWYNQYM